MKRLTVGFCLAATAASAANLKDPAAVDRDWKRTIDQVRQPIGSARHLAAQSLEPTSLPMQRTFGPETPPAPPSLPVPPRLYDAPSYRVPDRLPNIRPRGAIPWEYHGEIYWLVPLSSPTGK